MLKLFILALLFSLISAETCKPEGPKEEGCPIEGNTDYYGLGVRMGIYSAWLTSWFANNFLPEEIIGSLETNSIFLLALFATVFFYSVQENGIRVVDVLVIHQLCTGFLFSVMSLWGYRTMYYRTEGLGGRRHFGGFGTHFRLVLMGMITAYGVWFWIEGVEDGLSDCDRRRNCGGLQTFFVVPMKVESLTTRSIQLVINIGAATYYGIMTLAALACGVTYIVRRIRGKEVHWELIKEQDSSVNLTKRELTKWYIALSCFNLFWIIFAITSIEFTLNLNHMENVIGSLGLVGPGQLIPLAIGLLSLTRVLYILARQHIPWLRKKEEDDDNDHQTEVVSPTKYMSGIGLTMTNTPSTDSPWSPDTKKMFSSSPGQTPAISVGRGSMSTLPPLPAIAATPRRRSLPHRILLAWLPWLGLFEWSKHSLTPSLGHYSAFDGHSGHTGDLIEAAKTRDAEAGFEGTRKAQEADPGPKASSDQVGKFEVGEMTQKPKPQPRSFRARFEQIRVRSPAGHEPADNVSLDNQSTGLLSSPSQLPHGQKGLMSPETDRETDMDIELQARQRRLRPSDTAMHSGGIYDGEGYDDDDDYD